MHTLINQKTFTTKELIIRQLQFYCTKYSGKTLADLIKDLPHVNADDAKKVVMELENDGVVRVSNGLIFLT